MKTLTLNKTESIEELVLLLKEGWETYRQNAFLYSLYTFLTSLVLWSLSAVPFTATVIFPFYLAGLYTAIKKAEHKDELTIQDFLAFKKENLNLIFTTGALSSLLIGLGLIALVIPGFYALCAYNFTTPLVLEKENQKMKAWGLLEHSRNIFHKNAKRILLMMCAYTIITLLAIIPFGLGLFISMPLIACINFNLFKKIK